MILALLITTSNTQWTRRNVKSIHNCLEQGIDITVECRASHDLKNIEWLHLCI